MKGYVAFPTAVHFLCCLGLAELQPVLLGQENKLRRFTGRFGGLKVFLACSRHEDLVWSGGNAEYSLFFAFSAMLVSTVVWLILVKRQLDLSSVAARLRGTQSGSFTKKLQAAVLVRSCAEAPAVRLGRRPPRLSLGCGPVERLSDGGWAVHRRWLWRVLRM
ncbi:hypothetical protein Taro_038317 [Colocasia esculenta]|uniref:Uncharacterized protein n=1 Tax=Colocasia esculenta TaxID=4460 RepID=A0A843W347_COLES|nr:hypothetical protein [Colocasia esculenta]